MKKKKQWTPLVNKKDAKPYLDKLSQIAELLLKESQTHEKVNDSEEEQQNIALMGGKAGIALFFFYYASLTREESHLDFGLELLSEIFDGINAGFTYHTHAGGLAGIGWTVEHLRQVDYLDADTNEILSELDPYLHKTMIYDIENGNYDFLHGAVGNGTYFLNRLSNPKVKEYLTELLDQLDKTAHTDDDGARKWLATLDHEKGTKGYNLSLSHGISSIITFLSKVVEAGIHREKAEDLLKGSVQYLLKHKLDREKFPSNFPSWIQEGEELTPSRLAWCYGDLGIGVALLQAGRSMKDKEWEKIAVETLKDSTSRRDVQLNNVIDAGLCHGSAGLMHIYNRAYHETGEEIFKETALYWAEDILKKATFEDGFCGYKAFRTEQYGGWTAEAGFLEGVAGIGLSLISLISDIDPNWDRSLYIS